MPNALVRFEHRGEVLKRLKSLELFVYRATAATKRAVALSPRRLGAKRVFPHL